MCRSLPIDRTSTSPELTPTRICTSSPCEPRSAVRVAADGVAHAQRRVAGADGVILERERGAEERHDPVAHHLVHHALVAMDGLHHDLEDRIEQRAGLLRVALREELHRSLEVREQHGHLLALALDARIATSGCARRDVEGCRSWVRRRGRRRGPTISRRTSRRTVAPAGTAAPHEPQAWASRTPQLWQKREPSGFCSLQRGQFMRRQRWPSGTSFPIATWPVGSARN